MGAMFELGPQGLRIRSDPNDNQQNHPNPHHESGLVAVFEIANVGDAEGEAKVGTLVDDNFHSEWASGQVPVGGAINAVHPIGRHSAGDHLFVIYVNPGSGRSDHLENRITVD